jgi:hypothetical protein
MLVIAGLGVTGRAFGFLINENFKFSLSRLQIASWTILILSAFITAGVGNIKSGKGDALNITIPDEIWAILGISITSTAVTPMIQNYKKNKTHDEAESDLTIRGLSKQKGIEVSEWVTNRTTSRSAMMFRGKENGGIEIQGQIVKNLRIEDAEPSDLFRGEESGNASLLDIGKIQLFLFTLLILFGYGAALGSQFIQSPIIQSFPPLGGSILAIFGISNTGYLVNKAVPHSQTETPIRSRSYTFEPENRTRNEEVHETVKATKYDSPPPRR